MIIRLPINNRQTMPSSTLHIVLRVELNEDEIRVGSRRSVIADNYCSCGTIVNFSFVRTWTRAENLILPLVDQMVYDSRFNSIDRIIIFNPFVDFVSA